MKKPVTLLLLITIAVAAKAQNKDSIAMAREFDAYFKEGQKNFKFIKSIDSLKSINWVLQKDNYKKERQVKEYREEVNSVTDNLKLYAFLIKTEKDSLRNLSTDTSGYISKTDRGYTLMLKHDVDLEALKFYIGEGEVKKQLPLVLSNIEKGNINVDYEPRSGELACCGMSLPDWPSDGGAAVNDKELDEQYIKQEDYLTKYCTQKECGARYWSLYTKTQGAYKYPQQVTQMMRNQVLFKNFLDRKCP